MSQGGVHHLWVGVVGGVGGVVVGIFCCQIYIGCSETKLLICHKGGFIIYGWGWWWGGRGVDWVIHKHSCFEGLFHFSFICYWNIWNKLEHLLCIYIIDLDSTTFLHVWCLSSWQPVSISFQSLVLDWIKDQVIIVTPCNFTKLNSSCFQDQM